jgi:hypothetical protein
MKTHTWLVGASLSVLATTSGSVVLAQEAPEAAPAEAPADAKAAPKPGAKEDEGPFAPKGKTGRLREKAETDQADAVEPAEPTEPEVKKRGRAGVDFVFGFGNMGDANRSDKATSASFIVAGSYFVAKKVRLGLKVPFATGKQTAGDTDPNGDTFSSTVFGNVALEGAYVLSVGEHTELPITLELALPTGAGDADPPRTDIGKQFKYKINSFVQAARGFEVDELFSPHRFGIVPGAGLDFRLGALRATGFTAIPILIRAGGLDVQEVAPGQIITTSQLKLNGVGAEWRIGGEGYYGVLPGSIDLGARAWITWFIKDPIEPVITSGATGPSPIQFVLEPSVVGKYRFIRGQLGFIWPLGGRAGGDVKVDGLRLAVAAVF